VSETITVHDSVHSGHRLLGYPGDCRFVHGSTWRGTISVSCERFPRDDRGVSLDVERLLAILRRLDHRVIVTRHDRTFTNPELFDPAGIVAIDGRAPSAENLAMLVWREVVAHIRGKFPQRGLRYRIGVIVAESDDDVFSMTKDAIV
jgi:6-pyruvoyl-tetrahydropterin synthase